MSNIVYSYHFSLGTAGTKTAYVIANAPMRVDAIRLNSTGFAANGTNHVTISVLNGATSVASRTTDSGSSGTSLSADTQENLTLSNVDKLYLNAGEFLKITYVIAGTVALNTAINVHCELARDLS